MAFQKGQSGNPGGRPKDRPWRDALMMAVKEADGDRKKLRRIADKLVEEAMGGNVQAIKEIGDRLDGRAGMAMELQADLRVQHEDWIEKLAKDRD